MKKLLKLKHYLKIVGIGIAVALLRNAGSLIASSQTASLNIGFILRGIFAWVIPITLLIVIVVNIIEITKDILLILRQDKGIYPLVKGS